MVEVRYRNLTAATRELALVDVFYFWVNLGNRFYYKSIFFTKSKLRNPKKLFLKHKKRDYCISSDFSEGHYDTFQITEKELIDCFSKFDLKWIMNNLEQRQ